MSIIYPIECSGFYKLCLRVFEEIRFPVRFSYFSKRMYGNFVHTFLLVYRERLNVSYRRFVEIASELGLHRMLCIKKIPHYTTLQKFMQKIDKKILERMVRACCKLIKLTNIEASIDGTGFSNTNPSHYYIRRSKEQDREIKVKNYTKTMFLADNESKLILNIRTFSNNVAETTQLKPMVTQISKCLKTLLADKGYDSKSNRKHCRDRGIEVHIPLREWQQTRKQKAHKSKRAKEQQLFNKTKYNRRALIESVNSAIKNTLGSYVLSRKSTNQQKQVTIKAITYNLEHINKIINLTITIKI